MFKVTVIVENGQTSVTGPAAQEQNTCCVCGRWKAAYNTHGTCGSCYQAGLAAHEARKAKFAEAAGQLPQVDTQRPEEAKVDKSTASTDVDKVDDSAATAAVDKADNLSALGGSIAVGKEGSTANHAKE
jgi:hypothetical protein